MVSVFRQNRNAARLLGLVLMMGLFICPQLLRAQVGEYQIKAAYIEKFSRFLEWPATSEIADSSKPFVICILGDSPIANHIEQLYAHTLIRNKPVIVKRIAGLPDSENCHLLYIAKSAGSKLKRILSKANRRDIVTLSDSNGFSEAGVMINFFVENSKVLFEINYDAVRNSNIHVSYLLLKLARITGKNNHVF